ncbi:MAG TPA: 2-succinyl-5-enolpyruvyl-6-hydroxy-3-cyclohexene-1-carboxylic-acid synthase [Bacillota bacterium]|nr:2-succinyl-5-enolpyruvyl-6-hydroxy-3-cyclohexene-1-carboxylic-acid synthase [Bacillota bacterium]
MNHTEQLTKYCGHFVDELVNSGLTDVVISPGSRSTPLALTMCEHEGINEWVVVDERSAAYFALGMAKQTNKPVALLCTSGTAAVNYFPAITEAKQSRVPLIVLTTDRPHELRDNGAPQAIDQVKLFHDYVKMFHEMALPESSESMLNYVRSKAARTIIEATAANAGPVHLNFPFREPLVPDFSIEDMWGEKKRRAHHPLYSGVKRLSEDQFIHISRLLAENKKVIIICGPGINSDEAESITQLADVINAPILADPLANIRVGSHDKHCVIETYDTILRSESVRQSLEPDVIIRFGAMPVSKMASLYIEANDEAIQLIIEEDSGYRLPLNSAAELVFANVSSICHELHDRLKEKERNDHWLKLWQQLNGASKQVIEQLNADQLTEGTAVKTVLNQLEQRSSLFVANSMAIRDVDSLLTTNDSRLRVYGNRGVSGIDGVTSSAIGVAAKSEDPTTLIIGDLSFYHDLTGLHIAMQYDIPLTIILINNNGGGIFSFLPQSKEEKHFEKLYGTPLNIDFEHVVRMYRGIYSQPTTNEELVNLLNDSKKRDKLHVIEVVTDRYENKLWHDTFWEETTKHVQNILKDYNE